MVECDQPGSGDNDNDHSSDKGLTEQAGAAALVETDYRDVCAAALCTVPEPSESPVVCVGKLRGCFRRNDASAHGKHSSDGDANGVLQWLSSDPATATATAAATATATATTQTAATFERGSWVWDTI